MTSTLHTPPAGAPRARRSGAPLRRWAWRILLLLGLLLVLYVLVTFVQVWLASRRDAAQSADAIVVLGAAQYDCDPSPVLEQRLDHAHELYEEGVAEVIVVTGGKQEGDRCTGRASANTYDRGAGRGLLRRGQGSHSWGRWPRPRASCGPPADEPSRHRRYQNCGAGDDERRIDASVSQRTGRLAPGARKETGAVAVGGGSGSIAWSTSKQVKSRSTSDLDHKSNGRLIGRREGRGSARFGGG